MAVRPRDAASLVLIRQEPAEVLMGRRASGMAFMPDTYVFPGGGVNRDDFRACPGSPLNPGMISAMAVAGNGDRARALAMAAVRETFEETGLILGQPGQVGASPVWEEFRRLGLAPDLARLDYAARAITPTFSPIRFHARFFMTDAARVQGSLREGGELLDLQWVPLTEAERLPIAEVTRFVLAEVQRLLSGHESRRRALFTYHRVRGAQVQYF